MTGRHYGALLVALGCIGAAHAALGQSQFRSTATAVSIPASVNRGADRIDDLRADEIELFDNGVRQTVDVVTVEALPLDVTLVLDTSGSVAGEALDQLRRAVDDVSRVLTPDDRLTLFSVSHVVREVFGDLPAGGAAPPLDELQAAGATAVHDGVAAALAREEPVDRWPVLAVLTDGCDVLSVTSPDRLMELVRRSRATMHTVLTERAQAPDPRRGVVAAGVLFGGISDDTSQALIDEYVRRRDSVGVARAETGRACDTTALEAATDMSGGTLVSMRRGASIRDTFRRLFEGHRQGYLLRYRPQDMHTAGWHDVTVRITRPGDYTVRWRRGYYR